MSGRFINPYTFVPVNNGEKKEYDKYFKDELLSGKISCTLKARTQLAVCDKITEKDFDFFKVEGKAVIPGSSLRGTIRSIFEALTDSCFSSANAENDDYFSSRLNKQFPGIIKLDDGNYILYDAVRYKDNYNNQLNDYKTGYEVNFSEMSGGNRNIKYFKLNVGIKKGYVLKVDRFKSKNKGKQTENKDSVFEKTAKSTVIDKKCIELLKLNLEKYETKDENISKNYKEQFDKMKARKGVLPVWYYKEGQNYYLAPSQMSRAFFFTQPVDMLKRSNLDVCSEKEKVCEACALFGIVGRTGSEFARASRIRFSDAVCEDKNCFDKKFIMPISGTPRISSFEFYLKSDLDQFHADDKGVTIAGRKFYWHHKGYVMNKDSVNKEGNNMDYKAELVKSGSEFTFDVYFDEITENELKKLLFTLNLGENSLDSDKCHKIGHGKPIGLGSAKIVINNVTVRSFKDGIYSEESHSEYLKDNKGEMFGNAQNVRNILKVTDMNAVDSKKIHYPRTEDSSDIFKWFADNRKCLKSIGKPMGYHNKLPKLTDDDQTLPCDPKKDDKSVNGSRGNDKRKENRQYLDPKDGIFCTGTIRTKDSGHKNRRKK